LTNTLCIFALAIYFFLDHLLAKRRGRTELKHQKIYKQQLPEFCFSSTRYFLEFWSQAANNSGLAFEIDVASCTS
jgi:hypothetical protein